MKKNQGAVAKNNNYDLIIIGGGSAGFTAARKAEELNLKTLLINGNLPIGGTCLNVGCVPSKRLLHVCELVHQAKNQAFLGIDFSLKSFNFNEIVQDTQNLITHWRERDSEIINDLQNVSYKEGVASFVSPHEVTCNGTVFKGDKIVIATGSLLGELPIKGLDSVGYISNMQAFSLEKLPKSLIVIGAGPTGLELAQIFSRLESKVTILEKNPTIFFPNDKELTEQLQLLFEKEGIVIHTNATIQEVSQQGQGAKIVAYTRENENFLLEAEEILVAAGQVGNTKILDIDRIKINSDKKGRINVNSYFQTNIPHIFAAGDVINAPLRIESTAAQEGKIAVENAFSSSKKTINYSEVPFSLFTDPQLAIIGLQEKDITSNEYEVISLSVDNLTKATIIKKTDGLLKMIIHKKTQEIRGVQMLGPLASECINDAMTIISNKNNVEEVVNSLPAYPTISQAIRTIASII